MLGVFFALFLVNTLQISFTDYIYLSDSSAALSQSLSLLIYMMYSDLCVCDEKLMIHS